MGNHVNRRNRRTHITARAPRGAEHPTSEHPLVPLIPWLDPASAAGVQDIVQSVAEHHIEVQAVILFGSVARREERPLSDSEPSDVDLLLIIDPTVLDPTADRLSNERELALTHTIGLADYRHRSPRELNALFMNCDLARWDESFIENVAREGILLWARGPLPPPLAPVAEHDIISLLSATSR